MTKTSKSLILIKRISASVLIVGILFCIAGCSSEQLHTISLVQYISDLVEVDINKGKIIYENDTHGGFLGDGDMLVKLSFSDTDCLNKIKDSSAWKPLPLTKNLEAFVYGGTIYSSNHGPYIHDEDYNPVIPKIENGYYCFVDRNSESKDKKDDSPLLNRVSVNCSLAIYDTDTNLLYYLELDT